MTASTLAIFLGLGTTLLYAGGVASPEKFGAALRKFPRSTGWGYLLMGIGVLWFLWNLKGETIADFASYKNYMYLIFAGIGLGTCLFVQDFLAVRGLAVVMLLLAKFMVDTVRWVDSPWRLVIVIWAYSFVAVGMWFTISPARCRDLVQWLTSSLGRLRLCSLLKVAFGIFVAILGFVALRS